MGGDGDRPFELLTGGADSALVGSGLVGDPSGVVLSSSCGVADAGRSGVTGRRSGDGDFGVDKRKASSRASNEKPPAFEVLAGGGVLASRSADDCAFPNTDPMPPVWTFSGSRFAITSSSNCPGLVPISSISSSSSEPDLIARAGVLDDGLRPAAPNMLRGFGGSDEGVDESLAAKMLDALGVSNVDPSEAKHVSDARRCIRQEGTYQSSIRTLRQSYQLSRTRTHCSRMMRNRRYRQCLQQV